MDRYQIVDEPLNIEQVLPWVTDPNCGGVVVFLGAVRNEFEGRASLGLEYDAYRAMAEREMARIGADLKHRFDVRHVVMLHRVGRLEVTEVSVLVAVSAPHRREAFEACAWGIDRLKETVPIWKKEHWQDGNASWHDDPASP